MKRVSGSSPAAALPTSPCPAPPWPRAWGWAGWLCPASAARCAASRSPSPPARPSPADGKRKQGDIIRYIQVRWAAWPASAHANRLGTHSQVQTQIHTVVFEVVCGCWLQTTQISAKNTDWQPGSAREMHYMHHATALLARSRPPAPHLHPVVVGNLWQRARQVALQQRLAAGVHHLCVHCIAHSRAGSEGGKGLGTEAYKRWQKRQRVPTK